MDEKWTKSEKSEKKKMIENLNFTKLDKIGQNVEN